ncbi:hypothetical protein ISP17_02600 [Dyella ginsengisoli]|uniref:Uncharacterized protein n=1 Tax=Dyella ginsengisoli TaxID=363848 RepID=A0ABW8JSY5_9GAMM
MNEPDLSQLPYRRPPMTRGVDPQRMNWLWRLICELGAVDAPEVMEALHAAQVPVDLRRVKSWTVSDREASFFPITLAELERNLRSVLALRLAAREAQMQLQHASAEPAGEPQAELDAGAPHDGDGEGGVDPAQLEW